VSENLTGSVTGDFDARLQAWFDQRGWRLFDFQSEARDAYPAGETGLIHSPTGSGKSLAAWLGPLAEDAAAGGGDGGPRVLWITPLRALAVDTRENLAEAAAALGSDWRVEVRSGDTSQSVRARQRRRPPEALVTTPESLSVLLSYAGGASWFRRLACVVVDEWHELLGTKRGVQLELCLARLRSIAPGLRTWGLSATLANLAEARDVLLGPGAQGRLVRGQAPKTVRIRSVLPETLERFPWAGHLGIRLLPAVIEASGYKVHGWIDGDTGHGRAFRFEDPFGHVFELYWETNRYLPPADDRLDAAVPQHPLPGGAVVSGAGG